ncbi:MAG: flagellar filament capping protein FliD [Lachnospiraceae bacterium]|nr:flagellar filament capping protein FliD [Lachnospiraceae bacterium]
MAIKLSGLISGMDTEAMIEELVSAYSTRKDKVFKEQKTLKYKQDAWSELNTKIYGFYTGSLSRMQLESNYNLKSTSTSNDSKVSITAGAEAVNGTQELKIKQLAKTSYLTGGKIETTAGGTVAENTSLGAIGIEKDTKIQVKIGDEIKEITLKADMTIKDLDAELSDMGLNANFDAHNGRFFISAKDSGAEADFALLATDKDGMAALNKLGLASSTEGTLAAYQEYLKQNEGNMDVDAANIQYANDMVEYLTILNKDADKRTDAENTRLEQLSSYYGDIDSDGATKIDGQDAIIELNGAEFTSTTNSFQINGLTITAKGVTGEDEIITLTTDTDVDAIYNKIKDFFKEYNELMTEMSTKYNAESAGDYEPLTEEEEEELSETQIEKWEKILSTAALRRDSTLSSVMSSMRTTLSKSYEINGQEYSLSSFGIKTLGYFLAEDNEKANFHIDGDADDKTSSANPDKLRAAIVADPEATIEFFSTIMKDLYKTIDEKMAKSTETKSAFKIYNDKYMKTQYDSYTKKLSDWDDKIENYRKRYEKKFSNMEVAMSKLQSQTSAMASFFGTGQ